MSFWRQSGDSGKPFVMSHLLHHSFASTVFFPAQLLAADAHSTVQTVVCTLVGDLDHRFEHDRLPLKVVFAEGLPPQHPRWGELADELADTPLCCLVPLARMWKARLFACLLALRGLLLHNLAHCFLRCLRETTLKEECWHAYMRDAALRQAPLYKNTVAKVCVEGIARVHKARGGASLSKPSAQQAKRFRNATLRSRLSVHTKFRRPNRRVGMNQASVPG